MDGAGGKSTWRALGENKESESESVPPDVADGTRMKVLHSPKTEMVTSGNGSDGRTFDARNTDTMIKFICGASGKSVWRVLGENTESKLPPDVSDGTRMKVLHTPKTEIVTSGNGSDGRKYDARNKDMMIKFNLKTRQIHW